MASPRSSNRNAVPAPGRRHPSSGRRRIAWLLLPFQTLLYACALHPPVTTPVQSISFPAKREGRARCLVLLLPGKKSRGADFERKGFIELARERGIDADLVAVDLHFGYYRNGSFMERLWKDFILPARESGYEQIWVVGISMGGTGAIGLAMEHPGSVQGIILLSPYLGPAELAKRIGAAGGPARWTPETDHAAGTMEGFFDDIWKWLKGVTGVEARTPSLYLGYGREDKLSPSLDLLASALPGDRVVRVEGRHNWKAWRKLWSEFLSRDLLTKTSARNQDRRTPALRETEIQEDPGAPGIRPVHP
jgi:pimeloyl-ACP methyl ester carboxylesterase